MAPARAGPRGGAGGAGRRGRRAARQPPRPGRASPSSCGRSASARWRTWGPPTSPSAGSGAGARTWDPAAAPRRAGRPGGAGVTLAPGHGTAAARPWLRPRGCATPRPATRRRSATPRGSRSSSTSSSWSRSPSWLAGARGRPRPRRVRDLRRACSCPSSSPGRASRSTPTASTATTCSSAPAILAAMLAIATLAVEIPEVARGQQDAGFVLAYVALRSLLIALYLRAWRHVPAAAAADRPLRRRLRGQHRASGWARCSSTGRRRYVLWGMGLAIEYAMPVVAQRLHARAARGPRPRARALRPLHDHRARRVGRRRRAGHGRRGTGASPRRRRPCSASSPSPACGGCTSTRASAAA